MHVFIVGSGKLASELLKHLVLDADLMISSWSGVPTTGDRSIVIHAGSGREMDQVIAFCERTGSILVELATGSALLMRKPDCPVVLCPNTNILMLKFLTMLHRAGSLFADSLITITESHQAAKTSAAGTAIAIANTLRLEPKHIVSVRDPQKQESELSIPWEHLERHAVHVISIEDGACSISMTTRVYGNSPYTDGVAQIVTAVNSHPLDQRVHTIEELIEWGWL